MSFYLECTKRCDIKQWATYQQSNWRMELSVFEISEQSAHNAVQTSIEEKCNYTRVYELELGQRENSSGKKKNVNRIITRKTTTVLFLKAIITKYCRPSFFFSLSYAWISRFLIPHNITIILRIFLFYTFTA